MLGKKRLYMENIHFRIHIHNNGEESLFVYSTTFDTTINYRGSTLYNQDYHYISSTDIFSEAWVICCENYNESYNDEWSQEKD